MDFPRFTGLETLEERFDALYDFLYTYVLSKESEKASDEKASDEKAADE